MNNIIFKTTFLKGEDGNNILRIDKTATSGLVDTYTITLTDGTTTTFNVTNGSSIATIEKTGTVGIVDTYTITLTDGSTSTFEVTNGTVPVDDHLDANSTNPVENRVVTDKLTASDNLVFDFTKSDNQYGYKDANGNFVPFKTTHTDTYTYPSGSTGGTYDMGIDHKYRKVNATNVYNKGKTDGASGKITPNYAYVTSKSYETDASTNGKITFSATSGAIYAVSYGGGGNANSTSLTVSGGTLLGVKVVKDTIDSKAYCTLLAIVKATSTSVTVYPNGSNPYMGIGIVTRVGV